MYATAGRWDAVKELREMMENKGIKKEAGCSWLQIKSKLYTFVAGGCTKFRSSVEFKMYWDKLENSMKELGYIPDTSVVLHNVDEELKASWVCGHSERLAALAYAIICGASRAAPPAWSIVLIGLGWLPHDSHL
ncbi:hypothetical protein Syun_022518 [Stephania yunnanensis]|uniref:DYW domain-containing protein n=1 Tax=Stephania yunnanensis TaxID=152371 RepID=A0AAP0F9S8_9MAGN